MLVLSRKPHERILIGNDIAVTVVRVGPSDNVRLGIEAPRDVHIVREELDLKQTEQSNGACCRHRTVESSAKLSRGCNRSAEFRRGNSCMRRSNGEYGFTDPTHL